MTHRPDTAGPTPGASTEAPTWAAMQQYYVGRKMVSFLRPLPDHGIVYVKNPKAGCTTLVVWLERLHTGEHDYDHPAIHQAHRLPTVRDVGRQRVAEMLGGAAYRFSFVRDPVRRFESVYWAKMVRSLNYRVKAAQSLGLAVDDDTVVPFEQFLAAVEQQDPLNEMDAHWRPQHLNLMHPLVTYDHVGRLETFAADLERIREEAGLPHVPYTAKNVARAKAESVYDGRPDLRGRVEQLYAGDLELYGY